MRGSAAAKVFCEDGLGLRVFAKHLGFKGVALMFWGLFFHILTRRLEKGEKPKEPPAKSLRG